MAIGIGELQVGSIIRTGAYNNLYVVVEVVSPDHVRTMTLLGVFTDPITGNTSEFVEATCDFYASHGLPSGWQHSYLETAGGLIDYHKDRLGDLTENWRKIKEKFPLVGDCPFQ